MALVRGNFRLRGGQGLATLLRHQLPVFRYEDASRGNEDSLLGYRRIEVDRTNVDREILGAAERWNIEVPGETLLGESLAALEGWLEYATWEELKLTIPWFAANRDGVVFASGSHQAIIGVDDTSPEDSPPRLGGDTGDTTTDPVGPAVRRNVFLLNAEAFMDLLEEIGTLERDGRWLLRTIAILGRFTLREVRLPPFDADDLASIAEDVGIDVDQLLVVVDRWPALTSFDLVTDVSPEIEVAGDLSLVAIDDGPTPDLSDLAGLTLSAELSAISLGDKRDVISWSPPTPWPDPDSDALPVRFRLEPAKAVTLSSTRSEVVVRVRGGGGEELYRAAYDADDPALADLSIVVPVDRRPSLPIDTGTSEQPGRQLRGQVVRKGSGSNQGVGGLTVLVQTRAEESEALPRVFAATTTTESGSFFTRFPTGDWHSVGVLVSAAPDSLVELELDEDGRVIETFVYLLLDDADVDGQGGRDTGRLPGHDELIHSGEYRQDLGGGCINVTTPNRSLREYRYNAIVRTSDPDVSSYTLRKDGQRYVFEGGESRWIRPRVDLDNPIRWQHAPEDGDHLSFYQAVTVATGHILWYKTAFKSDGYSLGDLVYSLPLAPGQKKQIVSYDVANNLTASEAQQIVQGERLAATLFDDRTITDSLSGSLDEDVSGSSSASTSGVSAGLGLGGSLGPIGGSLGVSGGYANSKSRASQQGARSISQGFNEKLRQSLIQSSEAYRRLNASVVTQVREGQEYTVTTEAVANHNHCHSMTMMYFEVLRHYAITQELAEVQECLFVPFLLAEFTPNNVGAWKDVLAPALLPMPSNTYLRPSGRLGQHPLVDAFDANDRVRTDWARVNYPTNSYAEDPISDVSGSMSLRVRLPRPRTRADRIMSLPVITETVVSREVDTVATVAGAFLTGGLSLLGGASTRTRSETVLARKDVGDAFLQLDANYQEVPPARAIRVTRFEPISFEIFGLTIGVDFFGNDIDRDQWQAYAELLGYSQAWELLQDFFANNLISEWDAIFNRDIAPLLWDAIVESIDVEPVGAGSGLDLDLTPTQRYNGGDRRMRVRMRGGAHPARDSLAGELRIRATSAAARALRGPTTCTVQGVSLDYATPHYRGSIFRGFVGDDLLDDDGVGLSVPLTANDLRNPRVEDRHLQEELIDHLNANLEHYNGVAIRGLDQNRRLNLLDGFSIETYERDGSPAGRRSLATVVGNELITIAGNSLVFPVADGYHVSRALLVENDEVDEADASDGLLRRYEPLAPVEPYRLSVPTRGVYAEAVMGECDACEDVKENSSQDWTRFGVDEPTAIAPVATPTPQRTDWKAIWAQFASPLVGIQTARDLPAPGAGLAGLGEALTEAGAFRDVTGLSGNQDNVIKTYLSNQENAKAFAEMAKSLATQEHNTSNSRSIMKTLDEAKESGAVSEEDHRNLVRDHLAQVVDGGDGQAREAEREAAREPSLENAGIEAVQRGRYVSASTRSSDGAEQNLEVGAAQPPSGTGLIPITYPVPLVPQPNKTACWAASMAMLESYRRSLDQQRSVAISAAELAAEVGYSLEQSYGWDRLEDVRAFFDLEDIDGLSLAQYPTAADWAGWLQSYGPLFVTVAGAPTHAIVVHGISGDGTDAGSTVQIHNPWDTSANFDSDPTVFNPTNQGLTTTLTVTDLNRRFNGGQLSQLEFYGRWRILYSTPVQAYLQAGITTPGGEAGVACWPVTAADLVAEAVAVAVAEQADWASSSRLEANQLGADRIEEYWRSVVAGFPGISTAWSAVFISWLFTRAYLRNAPTGTTIDGSDLALYDTLGAGTRTTIMSQSNRCLQDQSLFNTSSNHYRYVVTTRALNGTTSVVRDPATTEVQVGDMILYGRSGDTYQVVGDDLQRSNQVGAPSSHIDIVVAIEEFIEVPGVRVAVLIGGNTLEGADRVGTKLRPLLPGSNQLATVGAQPLPIQNAISAGTLARQGTSDYYSIQGRDGYVRAHLADTEAIFRLSP